MDKLITILFLSSLCLTAQADYEEYYTCKGEKQTAELWVTQGEGLLRLKFDTIDIHLKLNKTYPSNNQYDYVSGTRFECCGPLNLDITTNAGLGSGMRDRRPILQIYSPTMGVNEILSCKLESSTAEDLRQVGVPGALDGKKFCRGDHCVTFERERMIDDYNVHFGDFTGLKVGMYRLNKEIIWIVGGGPWKLSEYRYRGDRLVIYDMKTKSVVDELGLR